MAKFDSYQFEDFLNDDSFITWLKYGTDVNGYWQEWLNAQPLNLNVYNEARAYLLTVLSTDVIIDDPQHQQQVWDRVEKGIIGHERKRATIKQLRIWSSAAAATICVFLGGLWYYNSKVEITTGYGEHRNVTLPDNSLVKLNANSKVSYYRAWHWHKLREVWLQGEALFDVKHLNKQPGDVKPNEQFVTHAGDVNVQVLGTLFNVKSRRNNVVVALIKGKIKVSGTQPGSHSYIMNSGQAIDYQKNDVNLRLVNSLNNKPLAWTEHKMMASGMSVGAIIENFEDTYGNRIVVDSPALLNKQIDGTISVRTRESTLYMLANLLNATVQERDGVYYLKSK
ncbi:FecR family protein [Mucilaginibacter terrae]|uniref:Transmembrane sensor n=1 Tax=Mucilaginibacter terrae TaxID=1955052 RepID=A0ABU3GY46_9SPHI|nr:FecR domain-containing protein [Mucilaginibacter terrae]MDT3403595.1 transmembrane sensor [Mucilaginibacter terrae]